jgi:hypothetical protein
MLIVLLTHNCIHTHNTHIVPPVTFISKYSFFRYSQIHQIFNESEKGIFAYKCDQREYICKTSGSAHLKNRTKL